MPEHRTVRLTLELSFVETCGGLDDITVRPDDRLMAQVAYELEGMASVYVSASRHGAGGLMLTDYSKKVEEVQS